MTSAKVPSSFFFALVLAHGWLAKCRAAPRSDLFENRPSHEANRSLQTPFNDVLCSQLLDAYPSFPCTCSTPEEFDAAEETGSENVPTALECNVCEVCEFDFDSNGEDTCIQTEFSHLVDPSFTMQHRTIFRYTSGKYTGQEILLEQNCTIDGDFNLDCIFCEASINGAVCNSCEVSSCGGDAQLPFTSIPGFDCTNIVSGGTYDPCINQNFTVEDFVFGPSSAVNECLRTVTPNALSEDVTAKCVSASPLEIGTDLSGNFADELVSVIDICSDGFIFEAAKFYQVVGTGDILTASTCREGTDATSRLSVFIGGCNELACLGGQSHQFPSCNFGDSFIEFASDEVSWKSEEGQTYYVMVVGYSFGAFEIGLTESAPPQNTDCENAASLESTGPNSIVIGSTVGGGVAPSCNGILLTDGVWYQFTNQRASQSVFTITTCLNETNFGTDIKVFEGSCGFLNCLEEITVYQACDGPGSAVILPPNSTVETYYVFISSISFEGQGGAGSFALSLSEIDAAPNSNCDSATVLEVGQSTLGSNIPVFQNDFVAPTLENEGIFGFGPGVWYSITPSISSVLQASTCDSFSDPGFITLIYIYKAANSSSCDSLETVAVEAGNDVQCELTLATTVNWNAEAGATYYLFVGSEFDTSRGDFELSITEITPAENDDCETAITLTPDDASVAGSNLLATNELHIDSQCGDQSLSTPGVWYKVEGTGKGLSVTTCSQALDFGTQPTLFEGAGCESLTCVDAAIANDNWRCAESFDPAQSSTLNWRSEVGNEYFILVHGFRPFTMGNFEISVTEFEIVEENNFCRQALQLEPEDAIVGSTVDASIGFFGYNSFCGVQIDNAGLWYSLEGTGREVSLYGCTASGGDYHVSVSVFEGSCSSLNCIDGDTFSISCSDLVEGGEDRFLQLLDEVDLLRNVTWFAQSNATYQIYVHGEAPNFTMDGGRGVFELVIGEGVLLVENITSSDDNETDPLPPSPSEEPDPGPEGPSPNTAPIAEPTDAPFSILTAPPTSASTTNSTTQNEDENSGSPTFQSIFSATRIGVLGGSILVLQQLGC